MPTVKPSRNGRKRSHQRPLAERWVNQSFDQVDKRYAVVRRLKQRLKDLIEYTGADTPQKLAICEEAVWLQHRLAQLRTTAIETGEVNDAVMTQMSNTLSGLLNKLGMDQAKQKEIELADLLDEEDDQ